MRSEEEARRIEGAAVVRPLARADQPLRTVGHFLPPDAQSQQPLPAGPYREIGKQLMNVKGVGVRRAGRPGRPSSSELWNCAKARSQSMG